MHLFILIGVAWGWNYQGQDSWQESCQQGDQSPVNINKEGADNLDSDDSMKMVLLGETTSWKVENTGNMIRVHANLGYIEVGQNEDKRQFNVRFLEFHVPSEHQFDGVEFPMELQAVMEVEDKHWERDKANMAVLSVIIKAGKENYFLNTLQVWELPGPENSLYLKNSSNINLRELVWNTDEYYFYKGSATHPDYDCRTDVLWFVIEDIKEAKDWQIDQFTQLFPEGNSRKVQREDPTVYYSSAVVLVASIGLLIL